MLYPSIAKRLFNSDEEIYQIPSPILVLVDKPWTKLSEAEENQLRRILDFIKVGIDRVKIIQVENRPLSEFQEYGAPIIAFGNCIKDIVNYTLISTNQSTVIQADSLDQLTDDSKKKLAARLKMMVIR